MSQGVQRMINKVLNELLLQEAPGPSISFTFFDLIKAIELIAEKEPIGRGKLSEELEIGGGAVRTLIKRLKNTNLVATSKNGCSLTEKGRSVWCKITHILPKKVRLKINKLTSASFNFAVLVRGYGEEVKDGLEQRDAAVRAGAKGAITIVLKNGKLIIPAVSPDFSKDYPEASSQITQAMNPQENDLIIIGSADDPKKAEYGAIAAAWTLMRN